MYPKWLKVQMILAACSSLKISALKVQYSLSSISNICGMLSITKKTKSVFTAVHLQ